MNSPISRSNMTPIAAACILSGGLIAAAIIDSHKPVTVLGGSHAPFVAEVAHNAPPLSQEAVGSQAEAHLLAAPTLHGLRYKGCTCDLLAAKATLVEYTPKDDQFYVSFDLRWKTEGSEETLRSDSSVATHVWGGGTETPPAIGSVTLSNDGYGHYFGTFDPDHNEPGTPYITVTVR